MKGENYALLLFYMGVHVHFVYQTHTSGIQIPFWCLALYLGALFDLVRF